MFPEETPREEIIGYRKSTWTINQGYHAKLHFQLSQAGMVAEITVNEPVLLII
jgi:hypothetical protein